MIAVSGESINAATRKDGSQVSYNGPGGPFRSLTEPYTDLTDFDGTETPFGPVTVP